MKKRNLFLICACLLCMKHAKADELIINDITIPQGNTADLIIRYHFDDAEDKNGISFIMDLPEGLSFVKDSNGDPVHVKDETSFATFSIIKTASGAFSSWPESENSRIQGADGTFITLTLAASNTLEVGSSHEVNVHSCKFQHYVDGETKDISVEDVTFTVTIAEPLPVVNLYETSETAPVAADDTDVIVHRTIKADEWSTLCLPFDMTGIQVKAAFGDDVQIADFSEWSFEKVGNEVTNITIGFNTLDVSNGIEKNHPYMIKVGNDISEFSVNNVSIAPDEYPSKDVDYKVTTGSGRNQKTTTYYGHMYGYYAKGPIIDVGELFISGNQFWYNAGQTTIKAFRATFYFADSSNNLITLPLETYSSANIYMLFDRGTTSLDSIDQHPDEPDKVYDLQGRRVATPSHGIYVKDGKKLVIK